MDNILFENCNNLDDLFELWKTEQDSEEHYENTTLIEDIKPIEKNSFNKDGYIDENEYKNANTKVLFILKEAINKLVELAFNKKLFINCETDWDSVYKPKRLNIDFIKTVIRIDNIPSIQTVKSCGFIYEETIHRHFSMDVPPYLLDGEFYYMDKFSFYKTKLTYGFAKNDKGEYIEGYLSDKEHFNGVLFLLKEPNTPKQETFYFRECVNGEKNNMGNYITVLNNLLKHYTNNAKLEECAYANMIPDHGMPKESEEYKCLSDKFRFDRFISIINECKPSIVFLCTKDFDGIVKYANIESIENKGVKYSNSKNTKRIAYYNDVLIYEIYHPSKNVKIELKRS